MRRKIFWERLWPPRDQLLLEAGASGELLVARIRLLLTGLLLLIPVLSFIYTPHNWENLIGLSVTLAAGLLSLVVYWLATRGVRWPWLGFASSALDVSFVSGALALFLIFDAPHTAVNSKVVFEAYFLAIGATALRYDARICVMAGSLALAQYAAIVVYAATDWDLNSPNYAPFPYGMFSWSAQTSRLILLFTASVLSTALVFRAQRLRRLSTSDRLTGLLNRWYLDEHLPAEVSRARRYDRPLALAMIDVDHFKQFNDAHGHTAGDVALCVIASAIRHSVRLSDIVIRYGGEEFVVVFPETDAESAVEKLEMIRRTVAETRINLPKAEAAACLTISAGIACYPADCGDENDLLDTADARLFTAKKNGRNCIVGPNDADIEAGAVPIQAALGGIAGVTSDTIS